MVWVVRELARLVGKVVVAVVVAAALAVLWAAVSAHSFVHDLRSTSLLLGCIALLMGAIGRGSNFERTMDQGVANRFWGRVPGTSSLEPKGEDPTLSPGVVFVAAGVVLLALGLFVL